MTTVQSDFVCFSHLRWAFVFQRPQHLMSRFARNGRVYFFEEPVFDGSKSRLDDRICGQSGVRIITPVIAEADRNDVPGHLRVLLGELMAAENIVNYIAWYYTPMAMEFTDHLYPALTVYDCMDELSAFANAPNCMLQNEAKLFKQCDLVFTGGASLFEAKRRKHERVRLFPSSVDVTHFSKALNVHEDPGDQKDIPHPRIGYLGVIDERMDLGLIKHLAEQQPNWQLVLIGPVAKINSQDLPRRPNIHYLGIKEYRDLPVYLSRWDVALLPFAQNGATRFISPTKTPEYLAAGLPVVSTPICDVLRPYGKAGLVSIGRDHDEFLCCIQQQLCEGRHPAWRAEVAAFLRGQSWDKTWLEMQGLITEELSRRNRLLTVEKRRSSSPLLAPSVTAAHV